jgi:D-tyrosyl-tRNA(Tyr) deacylase
VRAVLQRVNRAGVTVDADRVAEIGPGLMILLGVSQGDTEETCRALASKTARLRIFEDEQGKMNRSLLDTGGSALVVSQFTLYGDTRKGLRPSFTSACEPKRAEELYLRFASELGYLGVPVKTGRFAARMDVDLVNSGPVTILLDTEEE